MAPLTVSKGKLRKVLRRIERARAEAEAAPETARLSEWETDYLGSVETRLDTYGAAFRDPSLGRLVSPFSLASISSSLRFCRFDSGSPGRPREGARKAAP